MLTQTEFFAWLNPELSIDERYNPARLLGIGSLSNHVQVDVETWDHFLGCLPPMNWTVKGFCICEASTSAFINGAWTNIRLAFFDIDGRFYAAHVTDEKTGPHSFGGTYDRVWIGEAD